MDVGRYLVEAHLREGRRVAIPRAPNRAVASECAR